MSINRLGKATSILSLSVAMVLTGCGSGSTDGGEESADKGASAPLLFGYGTDGGQNYDPVTAGNQYVSTFLVPAYDTLFKIDENGDLQANLAEVVSESDDGRQIQLKLREDVTFHDGAKLTAETLKLNIERALTAERSTLKQDLASVETVEVVSDYEAILHLKQPDAALLNLLSDRAGMMVSPNAINNADLDLQPVGSGPYKVTAHTPGSSVTYEKFDEYWDFREDTAPSIEIQIQLDPETRMQSVQSGQTSAAMLSLDQVSVLENAAGLEMTMPTGPAMPFMIYLNMGNNPALKDPRVREAISLAVDREGIANTILSGQCQPTAQIFNESFWAAAPSTNVKLGQDLESAKKLLAEAGYADGFSMSLSAISPSPYRTVAEALGEQLRQINIDVTLQIAEPVKVVGGFQTQKSSDAYASLWVGPVEPSKTVSSLLSPTGIFNPGGYTNDEVIALANEGLTTTDPDQRAAVYQELSKVAAEDYMHIPLCAATFPMAHQEGVEGLGATYAGLPDVRFVTVAD